MWIRSVDRARRAGSWLWWMAKVSSHGLTWAALTAALVALVLPWAHDPVANEVAYRADLGPRGGWIVGGALLVASAGGLAAGAGALATVAAAVQRSSGRFGVALVAVTLVGVQIPWRPTAAVARSLSQGRQPRLHHVEQLLPAGPFAPPIVGVGDLHWPIGRRARITSGFGWRHHPIVGRPRFHNGIDIAVAEGTPVLAATDGRVHRAGEDPLNGRYVVILRSTGIRTAYCHLSEVHATAGQVVSAGDVIGASGQTGRATGPHLHFGTWVRGRAVDPRRLLTAR